MCKVFKLKTKTGLVTTTTDQSIVNCLIDNYDDELVITISNKKEESEEKENKEEIEHNKASIVNALSYKGLDKDGYVRDLENIPCLNLSTSVAKEYANKGIWDLRIHDVDTLNNLAKILKKHRVSYVIDRSNEG